MIRRPPTSTLFPYTTLFRSGRFDPTPQAEGELHAGTLVELRAASPRAEALHAERARSEEHTSELQSRLHLVCRLLLEKKKKHRTRVKVKHGMQAAASKRKVV